jgi:hypothetical protein
MERHDDGEDYAAELLIAAQRYAAMVDATPAADAESATTIITSPAAIPWYRSRILQGLLIAALVQGLGILKRQYHIDLSIYGLDANSIASWLMDALSAAAIAYAAHARVTLPMPMVTGSRASAQAINFPVEPTAGDKPT